MDNQKQLQALLAIVQKQQQMINKLAQLTHQMLPPQRLEPVHPELRPEVKVLESLAPNVKAGVQSITARGNDLEVAFKPGHANQAALDHITQTVQKLLKENKLPFPYAVKAV